MSHPDTDWMDRAGCRPWQHDLFFPEAGSRRGGQASRTAEHRAKRICARCPVRRECLNYAITFVDVQGMWDERNDRYYKPNAVGIYGGLSARERRSPVLRSLPVDVRLDLLEDIFKASAESFLLPTEEVA